MGNTFKHLKLILKHRHLVIRNASHCGIFFHALKHDLSKFSPTEFKPSCRYYAGDHSPLIEERLDNGYFSKASQHHTKRNPHHWEYWTDYFAGNIVAKTMPWKYAVEFVCDMISASYVYHPKDFSPQTTLDYFVRYASRSYLTDGTFEFVKWCLERYRDHGFAGLKKKDTKAKYAEVIAAHPSTKVFMTERGLHDLPVARN